MADFQEKMQALEKKFRQSRRAYRVSKTQSDQVLQTAPVAIIIFDGTEAVNVYDWNEQAKMDFGRSKEQTQRVLLSVILSELSRQEVLRIMDEVKSEGASDMLGVPFEGEGLRVGGETFPIEIRLGSWVVPIEEGPDRAFFTLITQDISDRKEAEALRALHRLDKMQQEFVASVSHELRTPLTAVKGFADLLLGKHMGSLTELQQEALGTIRRNTDEAVRRVNDILFLQEGRLILAEEDVSLREVIQRVLDEMRERAQQSGIEFQTLLPENLPGILVDDEALALLFWHLLDNAIKFSPDGGTITVAVQNRPREIYCEIVDTGIGIDPSHHEHIFERFFQVDGSSTKHFAGAGLGLAIARVIVTAHGGSLSVKSEPGKGAIFSFTLSKFLRVGDSWQMDTTLAS